MTSRRDWRPGQKVVWTDDDGQQLLGKIVGDTWERITVDFSEYPIFGLLENHQTSRVVRASEIRLQENESNLLLETTGPASTIRICADGRAFLRIRA